MDRSSYPTRVEVRSQDLANTELTKEQAILQRLIDLSQPGIVSGLVLQASSVGTQRFDLLSGYGYAPNGEQTELDASIIGQSPGTIGGGTAVLVGLMYTETSINPGAAETDGVARPRQVIRGSNLRVFTADQFNALPATFPQDLTQDAQDRFLVAGVATIPLATGAPLSIVTAPSFSLIKTIPQPSNVTGTVITGVSAATKNSNPFPATGSPDLAILLYAPGTTQMAYRSPFDSVNLGNAAPFNVVGLGSPVSIVAGGTFTLISANGIDSITVVVDPNLLPSATASPSIQDSLDVETVYGGPAQRFSAKDDQHRHLVGSRVPTAKDPHGLRFQDIATLLESLIGTLSLGTGYLSTLIQAEVPRLVFPPNPEVDAAIGPTVYQAIGDIPGASHFFGPANVPMHVRFYRSGFDSFIVLLNAKVRNSGANATFERLAANGDNITAPSAMIELSPFAVVFYVRDAASSDTWNFTQWDRTQLFHSFSSNTTQFDGTLSVGNGPSSFTDPSEAQVARIGMKYSQVGGTMRTCMWQSTGATTPGSGIVRIWRNSVADALGFVDAFEASYNCFWSNSGVAWQRDAAGASWLLSTSKNGNLTMLWHAAGSGAPWGDTIGGGGWDEISVGLNAGPAGGAVFTHGVQIDGSADYRYSPTGKTVHQAISVSDFDPLQNGGAGATGRNLTAVKTVGGTTTALSLGLRLPHGATLVSVNLFGKMTAGGSQNQGSIMRVQKAQPLVFQDLIAGQPVNFPDSGGLHVDNILTVNQNGVIDDVNFTYYVFFESLTTADFEIGGVFVTYTQGILAPQ